MTAGNVLITGAARPNGLGFEFVKQYLAKGYKVFATVRDLKGAKDLQTLQKTSKEY